ncbi:BamA/OMP85 family outer membrane protein [Flavobacterium sp. 3HN19-14]|uniref:BamA/OMP85 family outer membrane protein n=1 Tax=Flavobacterium sp. 3HN19-14 TaxID=3448133 RepID=UPI003EDF0299
MRLSLVIRKENADSEKQVNKLNNFLVLNKSIQLLFTIIIFGSISQVKAQERIAFDQGQPYILADVKVTGKLTYNQQAITTFAGLEKGQSIIVPGEEISNAIKKLGKLGLFSDIDFYVDRIEGDSIYLEIAMKELPKLSDVKINGVRKSKAEALIKDNGLTTGKIVNENLITTTRNYIENKYKKDGFFKTKAVITTIPDTTSGNNVKMLINIDKGNKVKISEIVFDGNDKLSDKKLRQAMKNTKQINFLRVFKASKFIREKYDEDLVSVIDKYKSKGYRDARIITDSVIYNKERNKLAIHIKLEEGHKYYFGNIKFLGNTVYTDQGLNRMLGIKKGDVYNGVLLEKRIADSKDPDADDITNLYQNSGYLFSQINAVETRTANDTIDFEIRIMERPIAKFNKISVVGNDKTNDKVIYRELRTKPGNTYSKDAVVRTIRELGTLGFFDPETIKPNFKNPDAAAGTVDIEYELTEKGSSQIELQGGYGGGGFIGTLGLSFNNFSMRNIFNKEAYKPLPMGDGQQVALRLQGSSYFQTYSLSFSEPWFGGKKPVRFNTSLSYSKQYLNQGYNNVDKSRSFNIISLSVGLSKRLREPDNDFYFSQALSFQYYDLNNYNTGLFKFGDGASRNLAYTVELKRNNKGNNLIFPTYGSEFSVSAKFTPPYSLWNGVDYSDLEKQESYKLTYAEAIKQGYTVNPNTDGTVIKTTDYVQLAPGNLAYQSVPGNDYTKAAADQSKVDQQKFKWLEYYKIKFKADWYTKIYGKFVLRSLAEFGFLGNYNRERGDVPFERFYLGGDGLANFALDGRETIQLRGYPNQSLTPINTDPVTKKQSQDGATIYNKFSLELRYPITLAQSASIYALTFFEAGAGYSNFKQYNPFVLQRSAGFGIRVFMPAFGLLGIDFGHGFDAVPGSNSGRPNGWETHFIIGQQF